MSKGVNKVILLGHMGQDPELRYLPNGTAVTNISVATNDFWTDANGERRETTEWHRVVFFGRLAEVCCQYLKKGAQVYVEGRLQTREWERDGVKRYTTEVIARDMQMLSTRGQGVGGNQATADSEYHGNASSTVPNAANYARSSGTISSPAPVSQKTNPAPKTDYDDFDDDIPF